tara:strand:- start:8431 stop:9081 length:651 start_codon:yes stop_codon:yes gene_type:complete
MKHKKSVNRSSFIEVIIDILSRPLFNFLKKTSITANIITLCGALFGITGSLLFHFYENISIKILAFILIFLYLTFDFIDGDIARYKKSMSKKGYALDIFFDKVIMILLLCVLYFKLDIIDQINFIHLILLFSPFYFQYILKIFILMKDNLRSKINSNENIIILIYRKFFFPTHNNIIFIISLGILVNLFKITFYFISALCIIAIIRQLYIIIKKIN